MFQNLLVAYDGSRGSKAALRRAALLAKSLAAEITALWVHPMAHHTDLPGEFGDEDGSASRHFDLLRDDVQTAAEAHGIEIRCVSRVGHPAKTIVQFAEREDCDLIVVGESGHSAFWGRLLGEIADRVADCAHCNVLVVKSAPNSTRRVVSSLI